METIGTENHVRTMFEDSPEFRRLLQGDPGADLTRIALEIARDSYPHLDAGHYLGEIDGLADRVRDRCPPDARPRQILGQINWVLFVEEKYRGDTETYYDARNSYLNEVIDRRAGIPISLSVLYMAVAGRAGLPMAGVNLPAHFVVRTGDGDGTIFVDPFRAGAHLDRDGCRRRVEEVTGRSVSLSEEQLSPADPTTIVARMLRNLKAAYLREHAFNAALPVLRRLVALVPDDVVERRDLGVSCLYADRTGEAVDHLQAYLSARPGADDLAEIQAMLRVAWDRVASSN